MKHITTIAEYCKHVNVHPPKETDFDARTFEENMVTCKLKVEPFKHEFYAIGLLFSSPSNVWHGIPNFQENIIFNSPYQLISWDIERNWRGYYVMFTQDFLMKTHFGDTLLLDFPFLKLDRVGPLTVPREQFEYLKKLFEYILEEFHSERPDRYKFIINYVSLILLTLKRFASNQHEGFFSSQQNRNADLKLVSRYQSLVETNLNSREARPEFFSPSFYASQLAIHPNHLNAIVKRITGLTAKQVIQEKIIQAAKTLLSQSTLSIKEIAYQLGYEEATHFSSFFKRYTSLTPVQYKESESL